MPDEELGTIDGTALDGVTLGVVDGVTDGVTDGVIEGVTDAMLLD